MQELTTELTKKEIKLSFEDNSILKSLLGPYDENLRSIEKYLGAKILVRGNTFRIVGEKNKAELTHKFLSDFYWILKEGFSPTQRDLNYALRLIKDNNSIFLKDIFLDTIHLPSRKKSITPKSFMQKRYIDAIKKYDIAIGIGPAGTGKTYLAMAMAMSALNNHEFERIILTRPAVEAGEKLGFLPGDILEKVNPYLRPLYDALHDMMDFDKAQKLIQKGIIEVAPLAFMRGRTLNNSFVILDEAQNTTTEQMKMFLTRLGFDSKAVITGDITQIDLPQGRISGLKEIQGILKDIEGIKFIYFSEQDVVRHRLVQEIIKAYEKQVPYENMDKERSKKDQDRQSGSKEGVGQDS